MTSKTISISLPAELIIKLDNAAEEEFASRSEYIRMLIVERLKLINENHARLKAIIDKADAPTEAEILRLLKLKQTKRYARQLQADIRKYPSTD